MDRAALARLTWLTECPAGHLDEHLEVSGPGADPVVVECAQCGERWEIVVWDGTPAAQATLEQLPLADGAG